MTIRPTRRALLLGAAAVPLAGAGGWSLAARRADASSLPEGFARLRASPAAAQIAPSDMAGPAEVWAYEGSAPGPEIRVRAGERVRMRLENGLEQPTAVHWHGIRIDNAMDGAAGLTQDPVEPGGTFDYDFVAPDPGTYWYHSHDRSWEQSARGLHGALIVEEPEPWGGADRDVVLVLDDWRLARDGAIAEDFGALMDWSHAGRMGNTLTANGAIAPEIPARAGERLRLRLVNAANARIMGVGFGELPATLVALDGHPTPPSPVGEVTLAPAQRADVVAEVAAAPGGRVPLAAVLDEGTVELAALAVADEAPLPAREGPVPALPDWMPHGPFDLAGALRVRLVMEGGAMGTMTGAMLEGRRMTMEELVGRRRVWAFNGVAGDLDEPLARIERGRPVVIALRNDTRWPHAMHLHGHHFRVLSRDGAPTREAPWRDTELMEGGEAIEIAFMADNPGRWLLHCHMLEHQAGGMITWLEVA
jgi:FtsP/CotA-like multicopper oxidase with cupredoxin domain